MLKCKIAAVRNYTYAATAASPPTFQKNPTDYEFRNVGLLALLMWHCTSMVEVLGLNPVPTPTKVKSK